MNIMIIIPSLSGGGAERVAITLASELHKNHKVNIVTYFEAKDKYAYPSDIHVDCLNKGRIDNPVQKVSHTVSRIMWLRRLKKRYKIECSISLLPTPNFENVLSKVNDKIIISIRAKCSVNTHGIYKWMNTYAGNHADKVVALSKNVMYDEADFFKIKKGKLLTIYNPCDIEAIRAKGSEVLNDKVFEAIRQVSDYLVITAGRVVEQKGQWHLIRAFSEVVKQNKKAKLVILGEGDMQDYCNELIRSMNLQDNIYMLGFHSNIYPYLSRADVFCFSSLYEGFGNILLEAMACGLPIISTDCDAGPRELLAPKTNPRIFAGKVEYEEYGVLTPVHDWIQYSAEDPLAETEMQQAEALCTLMHDCIKLKHYRNQSNKRIQEFSKESIIKEWEEIL